MWIFICLKICLRVISCYKEKNSKNMKKSHNFFKSSSLIFFGLNIFTKKEKCLGKRLCVEQRQVKLDNNYRFFLSTNPQFFLLRLSTSLPGIFHQTLLKKLRQTNGTKVWSDARAKKVFKLFEIIRITLSLYIFLLLLSFVHIYHSPKTFSSSFMFLILWEIKECIIINCMK